MRIGGDMEMLIPFLEQIDSVVGDSEEETLTKEMLGTLVQFLT